MAAQGQTAGDAGQGQQGQQGEATQGFDQNALQQGLEASLTQQFDQRLAPMAEQQQQIVDYFTQMQQQQGQQGEEQPGLGAEEFETNFGMDREAAQELERAMNDHFEQRLQRFAQEHLDPLRQEAVEDRWERQSERLAAEFPELQQPEKAQQVIGMAGEYSMAMANDLARDVGGDPQALADALGRNPGIIRLVTLASIGMEMRQQQEQEGAQAPNAARLEGGGGAAPAQPAQEDQFERLFGSQQRRPGNLGSHVLPFG